MWLREDDAGGDERGGGGGGTESLDAVTEATTGGRVKDEERAMRTGALLDAIAAAMATSAAPVAPLPEDRPCCRHAERRSSSVTPRA